MTSHDVASLNPANRANLGLASTWRVLAILARSCVAFFVGALRARAKLGRLEPHASAGSTSPECLGSQPFWSCELPSSQYITTQAIATQAARTSEGTTEASAHKRSQPACVAVWPKATAAPDS